MSTNSHVEPRVMTLYCTTCPTECQLYVEVDETGSVKAVTGNRCPRGEAFGRQEVICPMRILSSTVCITGASSGDALIPVRTQKAIPLAHQKDVMALIDRIEVQAPIHMGDIVITDAAGTGVDVIASCDAL